MRYIYINIEQAMEIHKNTIKISGGGADGVLDIGKLESVLFHIQNDDYYPTFEDKLTHLFHSACMFHCFEDGNKRIAISLGAQFLLLNGYVFIAKEFINKMENISYHVAAGKISKDLLKKLICSVINEDDYSEDLKLELLISIMEN